MAAIRIYRKLQELLDVDPNGLPDQGVPQYQTAVSSFVVQTVGGGGGGGSFSLGASNLGNTLGATGVTGTRVVLAGIGNLTLSQSTDANGGTISISGGTAGAGFSAGVSGGNTAGATGITGTRLVLAGGNNVTLSQATDANGGTVTIVGPVTVAQTVQTQNLFDLTLDGNTAGVLALVSSGTLTLAGGNSITLSQNGNAITISGASTSQSVQTQPIQTGISSIVASNATYTSGSVQFTGSGIITIRSSANQRVVVDASQSVQTQNMVAITLSGNTSGALALASSGTVTLAGGNNITLSQAGNAITISGANAAGAQTAISGLANSQTTYTSGTVSLAELGAITIRSTTGNQFQFSVNAQSVQPETQTFVGGIIASDTTYTSGSIRFTGVGGGVTVSSNTGQRVDISVAAQTVESQSFGMSNIGNTSGTTGIASGGQVRFLLAGGNNVTLSQSLNGASGTITISAASQSAESQSIGMSNIGNTSGTTGVASGAQVRMVFAGGNNVTLSQSLNGASGTITISAFNQSVQPETQTFIGGIANTETTYTSGTVKLLELGAITVRSTTGNQFQLSVNSQSVQPETQTFVGGIAASDTTYTSGTVRFTGVGGGITVSSNTGQRVDLSVAAQTVESQSIGMSNIGNTSGTTGIASGGQVRMLFAGGNNITLSQSLNGASGTITISSPNAQTGISGIANSQTTYTSGTVSLSELGAITIRSTTGNQYQFSVNAQTGTQFSAGISGGNTSGDTGTVAGRVVLAGGNNVTLSGSTNGVSETITISAFNQTGTQFSAGLSNIGNTAGDTVTVGGRLILAGSNGITLSGSSNGASQTITISGITQSVESQSIGMSNIGNTSGTTGIASGGQVRFLFAGGNNITLSQSLNGASGTITISAPNLGAGAMSVGLSNLGNTAGSTGATGTRLVLVASGALSGSQSTDANGGTITFNDTVSAFQLGVSTDGNTAGATGVTGTRFVLVGSSPISLSQTTGANGGTVTINAPATSSLVGASGLSISTNGSTISVYPVNVSSLDPFDEAPLVGGQQGQASLHLQPIRTPNLQYDRIALQMQVSNASNSSGSFTLSNWVGIYTNNASTLSLISSTSISTNFSGSGTAGSYSRYGGPRLLTIPWTMTLTASDYWFGINSRTTSGGADVSVSGLLVSKFTNVDYSGIMGAASNASVQNRLGLGIFSVSTAGMPASVAFTDIRGTGSIALRPPAFQLRSGTV